MSTGLEKETLVEKISGHLATETVFTVLAAYAATPLAALLPVLANSLASNRHKKRVEDALIDINQMLRDHEKQIKNFTDSQYKIVSEAVLTVLQTTEEAKITYLKRVIENSIKEERVPLSFAV